MFFKWLKDKFRSTESTKEKDKEYKDQDLDLSLPDYNFGGANNNWTADDERFLLENWEIDIETLARILGRTPAAIIRHKDQVKDRQHEDKPNISENSTTEKKTVNHIDKTYNKIKRRLNLDSHYKGAGKLNLDDVIYIYKHQDTKQEKLALKFDVAITTITSTWRKERWKWLTDQLDQLSSNSEVASSGDSIDIDKEDLLNKLDLNMNPNSTTTKLKPIDIVDIYLSNEDKNTLAQIFGVTRNNINHIINKHTWTHITDQIDEILEKHDKIDYQRTSSKNELGRD